MTGRPAWSSQRSRAELGVALRRPAIWGLLGATVVICAIDSARPSTHEPYGVLGSLLLSTDGNLTYGLAAALFVGIGVGSSSARFTDIWHTRGVGSASRTAIAVVTSMIGALACRVAAVAGVMAGGAIDGARRGLRWGSLVHTTTDAIARGQLRVLACYLVAAALGCLLALAIRHVVAATLVALCLTLPYAPFVGALANRAPSLLGALPWAPFGALRAVLSGNGAIFGDDPSQLRAMAAGTAAAVLLGWMAVLFVAALRGPGGVGPDRERLRVGGIVVAALASAGVVGGVLPQAIGSSVPWQWRPSWRDATAHNWNSRQVALRWATTVRDHPQAPVGQFFVSQRVAEGVSPDVVAALRAASAISLEPMSRMRGPGLDSMEFAITPNIRSGNVVVDGAGLQLSFRLMHGRWLIDSVNGPFIHAGTRPQ